MASYNKEEFQGLRDVDNFVKTELNNRQKDFGKSSKPSITEYYSPETKSYKGPKTAWCRFTSNAIVDETRGFQLFTQNGFDLIYGFPTEQGILGFDKDGNPHKMSNVPNLHLPPPGLQSVTTEMMGGDGGKFRKANIKMSVSSKWQLDYITPYFLVPGITCFIEWGWNNHNPKSVIDFTNTEENIGNIKSYNKDGSIKENGKGILGRFSDFKYIQEQRSISKGNYDCMAGRITNYSYSLRSDGGYDITLDVMQIGEAIYGLSTDPDKKAKEATEKFQQSIIDWFKSNINKLTNNSKIKINKENSIYVNNRYISEDFLDNKFNTKKIGGDQVWITFGLYIDIINEYFSVKSQSNSTIEVFKFRIKDSIISSSPNLKSCNGDVLLIPNPTCPLLNLLDPKYDEVYNGGFSSNINLSTADEALSKVTSASSPKELSLDNRRFDMSSLFPDPSIQFPSSEDISVDGTEFVVPAGYGGKLENLYINKKLIIEAAESTVKMVDMVMYVLEKMSAAASGIWGFEIKSTDPDQIDQFNLTIVDKNFSCDVAQFKGKLYTFNPIENNSIIRNLSFNISLPDSVATQTIFSSTNSQSTDKVTTFYTQLRGEQIKITDEFVDKLASEPNSDNNVESTDDGDSDKNKIAGGFTIGEDNETFKIMHSTLGVMKLVEPHTTLIKNLINQDNNPSNNSIYNGMVPGLEVELEILGISGIRFLDVFSLEGIPSVYANNGVYQVKNVKHTISDNLWVTSITLGLRPFPSVLGAKPS
jgi:hypothetical protein